MIQLAPAMLRYAPASSGISTVLAGISITLWGWCIAAGEIPLFMFPVFMTAITIIGFAIATSIAQRGLDTER